MTDPEALMASIKLSPETVAAIQARRNKRLSMTAEERAVEIRRERARRRREEARAFWNDIMRGFRR